MAPWDIKVYIKNEGGRSTKMKLDGPPEYAGGQ